MKRRGLIVAGLVVVCALIAVSVICPLGCAAIPPDPMIDKLNDLRDFIADVVDANPRILTDTNTMQQANALYNKIDAVKMMVEEWNYMGAAHKLENDISPKLGQPPDPHRSWLSNDPELQPVVEEFAGACQEMIEDILDGLTNYNG